MDRGKRRRNMGVKEVKRGYLEEVGEGRGGGMEE